MTSRMSVLYRVNVGLFVLAMVSGGVLFFITEHGDVSEGEKRVLAKMPQITWQAFTHRDFFRAVDDFVADNFVFRTKLTELSGEIRALRGWVSDDVQVFSGGARKPARPAEPGQDEPISENPASEPVPPITAGPLASGGSETAPQTVAPPTEAGAEPAQAILSKPAEGPAAEPQQTTTLSKSPEIVTESDQLAITPPVEGTAQARKEEQVETRNVAETPQTAPMTKTDKPTSKPVAVSPSSETKTSPTGDPYQVIEAVIVYRGRALQIMGGTPPMAVPMIHAVNRYQQELGPDVTVYFMAAPIGSDFYLPEKVNRVVMKEKILIDSIHARLNPAVRPVFAYDRLSEHVDEYLYFNTDHHWTGLGAYYAYTAFAKAAGFEPLPLSSLSKHEINNFLGTLYYRTMSPALKTKGDKVEYFKIPNRTEMTVFNAAVRGGYTSQLYVESAKGGNAYGVFLGGDAPLIRIRSDVNNNRKIVVIKDSYGNAFVPYLAAHYQEVYVIDYRSYKGNIKSLIRDQGIQDVVFAHNTFVVARGYAAQQAILFLNNPNQ